MDDLAKDKTHKELNSYYFMGALIWDIILQILYRDAMLAIVSLVFVFLWLRINTCSWFLSTVGILVSCFFIHEYVSSLQPCLINISRGTGDLLFNSHGMVHLYSYLSIQVLRISEFTQHLYRCCHRG